MVSIIPTPFKVYAGDALIVPSIRVSDSNGDPHDFDAEGWTNWRAQWRNKDESVVVDFELTYTNPGVFDLYIAEGGTRSMGGPGNWDLQGELDGDVKTWLRGTTSWRNDVTR